MREAGTHNSRIPTDEDADSETFHSASLIVVRTAKMLQEVHF